MINSIRKNNHLLLIFVITITLLLPSIAEGAEKNLFIDISVNIFFPSDSDFKNIYSNSVTIPEINLGYYLTSELYVFGGMGFSSIKGKTPEWGFDLKMSQNIFSLGGGYFKELSEKLGLSGQLALAYISYNEELTSLGMSNKSNCLGFRLSTLLQYKISKHISLAFKLGYMAAKDTIDDLTSNFGGLNTGLGIIFLF